MTAVVPEAVDLADMAGLDFPTPVLCDVNSCAEDKLKARPAAAVVVQAMPCCTQHAPICAEHIAEVRASQAAHKAIICFEHRVVMCSHDAFRIEPLT